MQTVKQTIEIVAYVTGEDRARVNQFARALLDADLLPKSSGRAIKKIGADKVLALLAAVAMADKVHEAASVAAEFAALPMQGETSTLADFFLTVLDRDSAWQSPQVEFAKTANGYTATVTGQFVDNDGELKDFILPFWRKASWGGWSKRSFTIAPEGIEIMRNLFVRSDIEGMTFSLNAEAR